MNTEEKIIDTLYFILDELEARNFNNNCCYTEFVNQSWTDLCEKAINLFEKLKQ